MDRDFAKLLLDAMPLSCMLWNRDKIFFGCNEKTLELFKINSEQEFEEIINKISPKYQSDGSSSSETMAIYVQEALNNGHVEFEWMYCLPNREPIFAKVTLKRICYSNEVFIAEHIRDLRWQRPIMAEIERCENLLQAINQAAAILLDIEDDSFESNLYSSMSMMVRTVDASRVYICKNHIHADELYATQLYEWSEDDAPAPDERKNISYKESIPDWYEILSNGNCINSKSREMSPESHEFLFDALSVFVAPIFVQDEFWGFVGLDDSNRERVFSENEASFLRIGCLLIGNAFLRNHMTLSLKVAVEESKAASISKSAFLAHMSHEIRTPMNSIIGFSELALNSENPPDTNDYLEKILKNSEWLLQIINDILDVSKIESGKMELENIPFDLHEIFTSCRTLIMPKAIEKSLLLHFYVEPSVGKRLFGDPTRLRQILVNLLSNAVKFTNTGVIKMQAIVKEINTKSVTMCFEVKDSGIGISDEHIKIIFDPFIQAESGMTRKFGGTGLGLAITKNLIEHMGGSLRVESILGVGSKFSFELTFSASDINNEDMPPEQIIFDEFEKPIFEGEVLLCEDNLMNQQVIVEHLSRVGLKTIVAHNGYEGVDLVENRAKNNEKQFDLIFMDIHMPVMDGTEAASKIIALNVNIPIVAMTANIMTSDREIYMSIGMSDCMGKPFKTQELWRCLMKYLKPIKIDEDDAIKRRLEDDELHLKLMHNFVQNNQGKFDEITNAINTEDYKLAHRLVHTLKGNAGQLDKLLLMRAADEVESNLEDGKNLVTSRQMEALKMELNAVITELTPMVRELSIITATEFFDAAKTHKLLDELEPLLQDSDTACLKFINELKFIPGSENIIQQMEEFDFEAALTALSELKKQSN